MKKKYEAISKKEARKIREAQKREALALRKAKRRAAENKRKLLKAQGGLKKPIGSGTGPRNPDRAKPEMYGKRKHDDRLIKRVTFARGNVPKKHAVLEELPENPFHPGCSEEKKLIRCRRGQPAKNAPQEQMVYPKTKPKKPYEVVGEAPKCLGRNGGKTYREKGDITDQPVMPVEHEPSDPVEKVFFHSPRGHRYVQAKEALLRRAHEGTFQDDDAVPVNRNGPCHSFNPYTFFHPVKGKEVVAFCDAKKEREKKRVQSCLNSTLRKEATEARKKGLPYEKPKGQASPKKQVNMDPKAVESRKQARAIAQRRKLFRQTRDQRVAAAQAKAMSAAA